PRHQKFRSARAQGIGVHSEDCLETTGIPASSQPDRFEGAGVPVRSMQKREARLPRVGDPRKRPGDAVELECRFAADRAAIDAQFDLLDGAADSKYPPDD